MTRSLRQSQLFSCKVQPIHEQMTCSTSGWPLQCALQLPPACAPCCQLYWQRLWAWQPPGHTPLLPATLQLPAVLFLRAQHSHQRLQAGCLLQHQGQAEQLQGMDQGRCREPLQMPALQLCWGLGLGPCCWRLRSVSQPAVVQMMRLSPP